MIAAGIHAGGARDFRRLAKQRCKGSLAAKRERFEHLAKLLCRETGFLVKLRTARALARLASKRKDETRCLWLRM